MLELLTNKGAENVVVDAPAFSLTKVMATVVPLLAVIVTAATDRFANDGFTAGHVAMMAVSVVGFLAVVTAADVLARAWATAAQSRSPVTVVGAGIPATVIKDGVDPKVQVVAISGGRFLCVQSDGRTTWEVADGVRLDDAGG